MSTAYVSFSASFSHTTLDLPLSRSVDPRMATTRQPEHPFCCKQLAHTHLKIHEEEITKNSKERPKEYPNPPFEPCYQFLTWATTNGQPLPYSDEFPKPSTDWLIAILSYHQRPNDIKHGIRLFLPVYDTKGEKVTDFVEIEEGTLENSLEEVLAGWWRSGVLECAKCEEDGPAWTKVPCAFELFWFERPSVGPKRDSIARLAEDLLKSLPREGSGKREGWRRLKG